jgi:hypothetical protein
MRLNAANTASTKRNTRKGQTKVRKRFFAIANQPPFFAQYAVFYVCRGG